MGLIAMFEEMVDRAMQQCNVSTMSATTTVGLTLEGNREIERVGSHQGCEIEVGQAPA